MHYLGETNNRKIFYIKAEKEDNWMNVLPTSNWLAIPIVDEENIPAFTLLAEKCIARNVVYVCALGRCSEKFHDIFDEMVVLLKVRNNENIQEDDFENAPMTIWDYNFDQGFWFAVTIATDENRLIDKVVCIDYTKGVKNYLIETLHKINQNWLPAEDKILLPKYDGIPSLN